MTRWIQLTFTHSWSFVGTWSRLRHVTFPFKILRSQITAAFSSVVNLLHSRLLGAWLIRVDSYRFRSDFLHWRFSFWTEARIGDPLILISQKVLFALVAGEGLLTIIKLMVAANMARRVFRLDWFPSVWLSRLIDKFISALVTSMALLLLDVLYLSVRSSWIGGVFRVIHSFSKLSTLTFSSFTQICLSENSARSRNLNESLILLSQRVCHTCVA
jgi:hypothetical protein